MPLRQRCSGRHDRQPGAIEYQQGGPWKFDSAEGLSATLRAGLEEHLLYGAPNPKARGLVRKSPRRLGNIVQGRPVQGTGGVAN
jgi:hypothetical protein